MRSVTRLRLSSRMGSLRGRITLVLFGLAGVFVVLWVSSYWTNLGIGLGKGSAPNGSFLEVSMVTDGLLVVYNGTRVDNICYDGSTGYSQGPSELLYLLIVEKIGGPHVWWPRVEHPAPWCGPYIFVPLWVPLILCVGLGLVLARARQRRAGICEACQYVLAGLPAGSPCPECGAAAHGG